MTKLCLNCNEPVLGRADKKFCTDYCRNIYNNRKNFNDNMCIRETNKILKKNHVILSSFANGQKTKIRKEELDRLGYNFCYYTGMLTKKGKTQFVCYDKCYSFSGKDGVVVADFKKDNL